MCLTLQITCSARHQQPAALTRRCVLNSLWSHACRQPMLCCVFASRAPFCMHSKHVTSTSEQRPRLACCMRNSRGSCSCWLSPCVDRGAAPEAHVSSLAASKACAAARTRMPTPRNNCIPGADRSKPGAGTVQPDAMLLRNAAKLGLLALLLLVSLCPHASASHFAGGNIAYATHAAERVVSVTLTLLMDRQAAAHVGRKSL